MMSNKKPLLPPLATLLVNDSSSATSSRTPNSPFLESFNKNNFRSDEKGIIRLPPLHSTMSCPRSVESAIRQSSINLSSTASSSDNSFTTITPTIVQNQLPTPDNETKSITKDIINTPIQRPSPKSLNKKFPINTPSTPVVKTKHSSHKIDMLTPLTAIKASLTPSSNEKKRAFAFITHSQDTFGVKEPKIDNAPLARRKRRRTSTQELNILQDAFENCPTPDKNGRIDLADRCSMSEKSVQIWFQNKRQAVKRQKSALKKLNSDNDDTQSTPSISKISNKSNKNDDNDQTPQLQTPYQKGETTPTRKAKGFTTARRSPTPTRGRGQALTFHLKTDKKILTPLKTSPNNKVNKLINGHNNSIQNHYHKNLMENKFHASSPTKSKSNKANSKLEFKSADQSPLKEINTNIIES